MRVFTAYCESQLAEEIADDWLEKSAYRIDMVARYELEPIQSGEKPSTRMTVTCKPAKAARTRAIILMVCCFLPLGSLPFIFSPPFKIWLHSSPLFIPLTIICVLLVFLACFSPLYTIGRIAGFCHFEEIRLEASFTVRG